MSEGKMTDKMQLFVSEYLKDFNATQAAIRAGYSEKTAYAIGWENLRKPEIIEEVNKQINEALENNKEILKARLIDELQAIAFHDVSKDIKVKTVTRTRPVFDKEGNKVDEEEYEFQEVEIIDTEKSEQTRAIASIKQNEKGAIEVKYHDKKGAIDLLGKYLSIFTDRKDIHLSGKLETQNVNIDYNNIDPSEARDLFFKTINKQD